MGNRYTTDLPEGWKGAFLAARAVGATVAEAADNAGVSVATVYKHKERDETFATEYAEALRIRRTFKSEKGWSAIEKIVEDPAHKDHFSAAKFMVEKNDVDSGDASEGGDTGIAEAIDRFTQTVLELAARRGQESVRDLPDAPRAAAELPPGDTVRPAEG